LKVLITGAAGMAGRALRELCEASGDIVFAYDHAKLDIANAEDVWQAVDQAKPDAVINCAAWTDVDGCESDVERAFAVNARGPENLAVASRAANAAFVTISTDYVFDGTKEGFYTEDDAPNPQSVYGRAKLEGERLSRLANDDSIVVRSGYIFGRGGTNFLSTVVRRIQNAETLKVISDTYGTPTYGRDLAVRLRELAQSRCGGIYHVVNSGPGVSFAEFTRKTIALLGKPDVAVEEVSASMLKRPANRPQNSRMSSLRMEQLGFPPLRDWESALAEFVKEEQPAKQA
jgi:dTDP-4-dehydrorhamnose reductase